MPGRPVLIAGPTASGKSALALALAERDGGWIVNADALQVYGCWRVLTARPDDADMARAPHRLFGHVDAARRYSVGDWLRDVEAQIDAARSADARLIVVGGTGLYLSALTRGLAAIPPIPPEIRARSDAALREDRIDDLRADLMRDDPETSAAIDLANPARVQRAWDVLAATGRGLRAWQADTADPILAEAEVERVVLAPEVDTLNGNIIARFRKMIAEGALDEVVAFRGAGHDLTAPSGRALGAAELADHLDGATTLEAALERAGIATRRFAKRQRTWFRNQMPDWPRVDPALGIDAALARIPPR